MKHIRHIQEGFHGWDPPDDGPDPEPYYGTELKPGERLFDLLAISTAGGLLRRRGTNELWWMDLEGDEVRDAMQDQNYWPRWPARSEWDDSKYLDSDEVEPTAFVDFVTDLYRGNTRNLGKYNPSDFLGDGLKNWYTTIRDEAGRYVGQEEGEGGVKPIVKVDPDLAEELIKEVGSWYLSSKPRNTKYQTNSASVNTTAYRKIVNALAKAYPPQKS
jgi:hypothetical protein